MDKELSYHSEIKEFCMNPHEINNMYLYISCVLYLPIVNCKVLT